MKQNYITQILTLLKKSVEDKTYDIVMTNKNINTRVKYHLTIEQTENMLLEISEKDLYEGPIQDRDRANEELFVFIKKYNGVDFYIKIKRDYSVKYERIKIISFHEAEYRRNDKMKTKGTLKVRHVTRKVQGYKLTYDEKYVVDEKGKEIFDRNVWISNDKVLYDLYKEKIGLLTISEIRKIRKKYKLSQKDYSLILGLGEVTVNRFEMGSVQSESIDSIMRLSAEPKNMKKLLIKNGNKVSEEVYNNLLSLLNSLEEMEHHIFIDISEFKKGISFNEEEVIDVAKNIIKKYNSKVEEIYALFDINVGYITSLKLQKLLYYVQAMSLSVFDKSAFNEKILAWKNGPVVNEVYQYYKSYKDKGIYEESAKEISEGLMEIIDKVINTYGELDTLRLVNLTHKEDPWLNASPNEEITKESIKEYFKKAYENK